MEHSVLIATQNYRESICESLRELRDQEQLPMQMAVLRQGKRWLIQCWFQDSSYEEAANEEMANEEMIQKIQYYYLANALVKTVLQHWEKDYIWKTLRRKAVLGKEERRQVAQKVGEYLDRGLEEVHGYKVNRKTDLVSQVTGCLDQNAYLDVEGFLQFRAQEYKSQVNKAVEYVFDEYVMEKEYAEFIFLLKQFVDTQKPRLEWLHVGMTPQGKFHLYDDAGLKVTHQFLNDYQLDNVHELGYEDLLVSALIAVAPRRITLHIRDEGYRDTLNTIRHVFGDRVHDCPGCALCEKF